VRFQACKYWVAGASSWPLVVVMPPIFRRASGNAFEMVSSNGFELLAEYDSLIENGKVSLNSSNRYSELLP